MADFKISSKRRSYQMPAPSFGGGSNPNALAERIFMQNEALRQQIDAEKRKPFVSAEEEKAKTAVQAGPSLGAVKGTLNQLKSLSNTVTPQQPGIKGIISGAGRAYGTATGQEPQIKEYERLSNSMLAQFARTMATEKGNLANQDIARMKSAFLDMKFDTEDSRALGWDRFVDTYNDIIEGYGSVDGKPYVTLLSGVGKLDKREFMTPREIGRSRILKVNPDGSSPKFDDLSDEELTEATNGDLKVVPLQNLQSLQEQGRKRGLTK